MTVTYTHKVANARLGGFTRLLIRWKGSVYKLFYKEFIIYIILYSIVSVLYRYGMSTHQRIYFEKLCLQFEHYTDLIPISFVLGFYVSIVVTRWWSQFESMPWPDRIMMVIGSNVHGTDDRGRLLRRTLIRYLNLAQVLAYRCVSTAVYKRFPTMEHVVTSGIMTEQEYKMYENVESPNLKYWVPVLWFNNLLSKIRQEGRIYDDMTFNLIIKEANRFRSSCGQLVNYDWISIPLVYTQVVTVAVYMFFISTLLSRQYLDTERNYHGHGVDLYVPIFTICQFFFYVGWLKVAEQLINPFGEDDDDFEVNWVIDRNLEVSLLACDQLHAQHPKIEKDVFWNDTCPSLPYTAASANHKIEPFMGSTFDMSLNKEDQEITDTVTNSKTFAGVTSSTQPIHIEVKEQDSAVVPLLRLPKNRRKKRRGFGKVSISSLVKNSRNALSRNDEISSSSSDEHNDDQDSAEESIFVLSDLGDGKIEDRLKQQQLNDPNNNDKFLTQVQQNNIVDTGGAAEEHLDSTTDVTVEGETALASNNRSEQEKTGLDRNSLVEKPTLNKPNCLNLNIQFASGSAYSVPSSIRLQCADEQFAERKNAEKRVHLYERRKKGRQQSVPRKRPRNTESEHSSLWQKRQQKRIRDRMNRVESPGIESVWSESDIGSGPANDSPFGSLMSCSASIPSPKQLRWITKHNRKSTCGDTTSIASTVTSPSGAECNDTEPMLLLPDASINPDVNRIDQSATTAANVTRSMSTNSSGREDIPTPYMDDIRKRLQVVPTNSPAPSSPLKNGPFFPDNQKTIDPANPVFSASFFQPQKSSGVKKAMLELPKTQKRKPALRLRSNSNKSDKKTIVANSDKNNVSSNKSSFLFGTRNANKTTDPVDKQVADDNSFVMRRNSNGLWKTLKTWNAKRKETKMPKDKLEMTTPVRKSSSPCLARGNPMSKISLSVDTLFEKTNSDVCFSSPQDIQSATRGQFSLQRFMQQDNFVELESGFSSDDKIKSEHNHVLLSASEFIRWENEDEGSGNGRLGMTVRRSSSVPDLAGQSLSLSSSISNIEREKSPDQDCPITDDLILDDACIVDAMKPNQLQQDQVTLLPGDRVGCSQDSSNDNSLGVNNLSFSTIEESLKEKEHLSQSSHTLQNDCESSDDDTHSSESSTSSTLKTPPSSSCLVEVDGGEELPVIADNEDRVFSSPVQDKGLDTTVEINENLLGRDFATDKQTLFGLEVIKEIPSDEEKSLLLHQAGKVVT